MLFTTEGIGEFLSGVILFDETIRQKTSDGTPMPQALERAGVIPGIKVDKSTVDPPLSEGEKFTQGLDGLGDRLAEYSELAARFTKWRAVVTIGDGIPTESCIEANAEALALYAAFAQEHDLVPDSRARGPDRRRSLHRAVLRRNGVDAESDLRRDL